MPNSKKNLPKRARRKLESYCIRCGGMLDPDTYICVQCTTPKKLPKGATSQEPPLTTDAMTAVLTAVLKAAYEAGLAEGRKTAQQFVYRSCDASCPCRVYRLPYPVTPPSNTLPYFGDLL